MERLSNLFMSIGQAVELVVGSLEFVSGLPEFLPPVIGSAVIVYLATYVIRFCLLK